MIKVFTAKVSPVGEPHFEARGKRYSIGLTIPNNVGSRPEVFQAVGTLAKSLIDGELFPEETPMKITIETEE